MAYQLIDTHLQIWNPERFKYAWLAGDTSILNQTYELSEIEHSLHFAGVSAAVLIQASNTAAETQFLLNSGRRSAAVRGVVGWTDLTDPEKTAAFLDSAKEEYPLLKGLRHLNQEEPDPAFLTQTAVLESLAAVAERNFSLDVTAATPQELECLQILGEKVPRLRMVLDHLGSAVYFGKSVELWEDMLEAAAENPNLYAKISGLGTAIGNVTWTHFDIHDLLLRTLNLFGAERVFCGGDWPTCLLCSSYEYTWQQYTTALEELLNPDEYSLVFRKNAERFYRL